MLYQLHRSYSVEWYEGMAEYNELQRPGWKWSRHSLGGSSSVRINGSNPVNLRNTRLQARNGLVQRRHLIRVPAAYQLSYCHDTVLTSLWTHQSQSFYHISTLHTLINWYGVIENQTANKPMLFSEWSQLQCSDLTPDSYSGRPFFRSPTANLLLWMKLSVPFPRSFYKHDTLTLLFIS